MKYFIQLIQHNISAASIAAKFKAININQRLSKFAIMMLALTQGYSTAIAANSLKENPKEHSMEVLTTTSTCPIPKPFQRLTETAAKQYHFDKIIAPLTKQTEPTDKPTARAEKPKMLNFWAAWCAPCRAELPLLDNWQKQQLADIHLINVGDDQAIALRLLKELNINHLPNWLASDEMLSELSLLGLPATIVWYNTAVYLGMGKLDDNSGLEAWLTCLSR